MRQVLINGWLQLEKLPVLFSILQQLGYWPKVNFEEKVSGSKPDSKVLADTNGRNRADYEAKTAFLASARDLARFHAELIRQAEEAGIPIKAWDHTEVLDQVLTPSMPQLIEGVRNSQIIYAALVREGHGDQLFRISPSQRITGGALLHLDKAYDRLERLSCAPRAPKVTGEKRPDLETAHKAQLKRRRRGEL